MSQTVSPGADQPYGVQRVCRIWEQARSTFYHAGRPVPDQVPKRRGPRPLVNDEDLIGADSSRLGNIALYRRRAPQSLGAAPGS